MPQRFGERIRKARKEKGLGLRATARDVGISATFLSRIESGKEDAVPREEVIRKLAEVLDAAAAVMTDALGQGGTSFDSLYVNVNGQSGYFDRSLNVYGQEDRNCRRCGSVIRRDRFMNRSSFYCPTCQPPPRRRVRE